MLDTQDGTSPEPVLFVPGMMCDFRLFAPQMQSLAGQHPVQFAPISGASSIEHLAARIAASAPPRFALVGYSMGGMVAMELARIMPERISRLCLMDTSPLGESAAQAAFREPQMIAARHGRLEEMLRDVMRLDYLAPGPGRLAMQAIFVEMGMALGPAVFVRQSRALQRRRDQQAMLRQLRMPVLVMVGAHDRMTPVRRHEMMATLIPGAQLEVIEGAGHMPTLEQPERVTSHLRDWLGEPLLLR
ncbi:MAG: alpha/beta hydrolase [Celeribacter sp.]